ncbi:MAG: hypothetical protein A2103_02215 [Gammaproteobacteria bacterium GWF2_41_13]|nr:MAG: hypothetical protein A2103_02215 [Gammaproteobacteria bacterium GWF2_41_13]
MQSIKYRLKLFAKTLLLLIANLLILSGCATQRTNFPPKELSVVSVSSVPETQGTTYGHNYVYCDHCPMSTMKTAAQDCNVV